MAINMNNVKNVFKTAEGVAGGAGLSCSQGVFQQPAVSEEDATIGEYELPTQNPEQSDEAFIETVFITFGIGFLIFLFALMGLSMKEMFKYRKRIPKLIDKIYSDPDLKKDFLTFKKIIDKHLGNFNKMVDHLDRNYDTIKDGIGKIIGLNSRMFDVKFANALTTNISSYEIMDSIFKNTNLTIEKVTLRNRAKGFNFKIKNFMSIVIDSNVNGTDEEYERDDRIKRLVGKNCGKQLSAFVTKMLQKFDTGFWDIYYDPNYGSFWCVLTTDGNFVNSDIVDKIKELYNEIK